MTIGPASPRWQWVTITSFVYLCLLAAQPPLEGEGRVVALDAEKGAVTLDDGPIPGLMPAMRSFADRIASGTIKTDKSPKELVRLYSRRIE